MKCIKKNILWVLIIGIISPIFAQTDNDELPKSSMGMQLCYGVQLSDFDEINTLLNQQNYPELSPIYYITGGGIVVKSEKFISEAIF